MISFIEGKVIEKNSRRLVVIVGGLGLEIQAPAGTLDKAPEVGRMVSLHTYLHVREDVLQLYGFDSPRSRDLFTKLMSLSGFGPQKALAVLSVFSPEGFETVIRDEDADSLTRIPGVGKKSAERLILEMRDKIEEGVPFEIVGATPVRRRALEEATEALVALGFSRPEAHESLKGYPAGEGEAKVEEMLQFALKQVGR